MSIRALPQLRWVGPENVATGWWFRRPSHRRRAKYGRYLSSGGTQGQTYTLTRPGAPEHPGWYRNTLANPEVDIRIGTKKMRARARTAVGEKRERLWEQAVKLFLPYADYRLKAAGREIPVVVLDPVS